MTLITAARRRTAEVIELHKRREYAVFTIDDNPDRGYFGLGIESSYGGFAFAWSHPGRSFREFLAQLNLGYVLSKMVCPAESEFDGEETELFQDAPWEFQRSCGGARSREFTALFNLFWSDLAKELTSK